MNNIDTDYLRNVAENAPSDELRSPSPTGRAIYTGDGKLVADQLDVRLAEFIAAADPKTILTLLDYIDHIEEELITRYGDMEAQDIIEGSP